MTKKLKNRTLEKSKLTPNQELFCQYYTSGDREMFGSGVNSYLEVFGNGKMKYNVAAAAASRILRDDLVIARINELLETGGFSDENIDKQHLFLINQHADLKAKLGAIKEYNVLKQRVKTLMDVTSGGEKILVMPPQLIEKNANSNTGTE